MYDPTLSVLRAILSLCATLGLIVICGWLWRRYGSVVGGKFSFAPASPRTRRLNILETQRLGAQTTLHLVRLDETDLLISTTAAQTTLIHAKPAAKSAKVKS